MDVLTISLMLAAGLLHASWHSLVKSGQNQITVLAGMGAVAGLCAVAALPFVPFPAAEIWPVLMLSVGLHIAYKLCLAGAYARGDFGQAFPLARGMVPLFATVIAFIGLNQVPSINQCVGIVMVSSGLLLLSLDKIHGLARWPLLLTAAAAGAAGVVVIAAAAWGGRHVTEHAGLLGYAIGAAASFAAAVALGLYVAARRRVVDGLRERAERLDHEEELLAEQAVAEERTRIAQELHDIVAHNVTLMVVEAQALGATIADDRVTQSTDAIADLGRQAMSEMHTTLRLLRGDSETPELAPQPGLDQLEPLLEQLRRAGLEVELSIEGQPHPLPRSVELSAYRIIQEALTNVVKHAAGARTEVKLAYAPEALELTILDRGDLPQPAAASEPSNGHGLIGMRERVALFGGTLTTHVLPNGFRVKATLPYVPSAL